MTYFCKKKNANANAKNGNAASGVTGLKGTYSGLCLEKQLLVHVFRRKKSPSRALVVCSQVEAATRFSLPIYVPQGRPAGRRSG